MVGISVKKHAYIIKIKNKKYYTAHGCILLSLGKRKIGKEIFVFKNEKYGKEVFKLFLIFVIEIVAFLTFFIRCVSDLWELAIKVNNFISVCISS